MAKLEFRWAVLIITTVLALLYVQAIRYTDCRVTHTRDGAPARTVCIDKITGKGTVRR